MIEGGAPSFILLVVVVRDTERLTFETESADAAGLAAGTGSGSGTRASEKVRFALTSPFAWGIDSSKTLDAGARRAARVRVAVPDAVPDEAFDEVDEPCGSRASLEWRRESRGSGVTRESRTAAPETRWRRSGACAIFVPPDEPPRAADLRGRAGVSEVLPFRSRNGRAADLLISKSPVSLLDCLKARVPSALPATSRSRCLSPRFHSSVSTMCVRVS